LTILNKAQREPTNSGASIVLMSTIEVPSQHGINSTPALVCVLPNERLRRGHARRERAHALDMRLECETILRDLIRDGSITLSQRRNFQRTLDLLQEQPSFEALLGLRNALYRALRM
jgi:hypothetical protein